MAGPQEGTQTMAKRTKTTTIPTFIVSWFPISTTEALTITCLTRDHANRISEELRASFAPWPDHDPLIHIDRAEERVSF
jgi:hypothetical protein